ncbi:hypothetical protein [Streptomyces sp. NPDC020917]|uniref:hypothetical protein n=1 Tax=Streptomyces sp. NPDC020917 TaxID=3365102 RepID=UPI0037AB9C2F
MVAGLQATGKSTLAELVAHDLAAPVFAWDRLMAPLKKHRMLAGLDYEKCLDLGFDLIQSLVLNQLRLGQPAIVDSLVDQRRIDAWRPAVEVDARIDAARPAAAGRARISGLVPGA